MQLPEKCLLRDLYQGPIQSSLQHISALRSGTGAEGLLCCKVVS